MTNALNGRYVLDRRLGAGGMAEVFAGRMLGAEGFSRPVAIKRVLDAYSQDPKFSSMFITEAQLSSRLVHPNIVSPIDFDRDAEGRLFLVMEMVDGVDLDGLTETGPLPFSLVIHLAIEILRGLDYAHDLPVGADGVRGLVHRDISPHNVLLSWEGAAKVSDFGIAKARAASNASASVLIKGKPSYMSPEQVNGQPLDGRSDLFAVGVMLFEMLCNERLFAGGTLQETLGHVLHKEIPAPRARRPEVPEDLSRVVSWLLMRDRDQRPPNAAAAIAAFAACTDCPRTGREELIELLSQRFVGRAPVRAHRVSPSSPSAVPAVSPLPPMRLAGPRHETFAAPGATPLRGRRWRWAVLAALLTVCSLVGLLAVTARSTKPLATTQPTVEERAVAGPPTRTNEARSSPLAVPEPGHAAGSVEGPATRGRQAPTAAPTREPAATPKAPARRGQLPAQPMDGIREVKL